RWSERGGVRLSATRAPAELRATSGRRRPTCRRPPRPRQPARAAPQARRVRGPPTTARKAAPPPPLDAPREEIIRRALEVLPNTCPFDVTGHPAMSVPCGMSQGLPLGMMLIGRSWEDGTVLRAAHAFEQVQR